MKFASFRNARIVRSSWLEEGGRRLDCNPYMSGALEARDALKLLKAPKEKLKDVTTGVFHAGREGRLWVDSPEYGVPFLGSTDILNGDLSTLPLISKKQVKRNPNFTLGEKWTLITRSGTIGRMAYVRPDMAGLACSEHVLRVVPDEAKIPPGYLYAFLSSKFGVPLVVSGTYGAIIQHIEPEHILERVTIPRFSKNFESNIANQIDESARLFSSYQAGVLGATKRFFDAVGLVDISAHEWHQRGRDLGFSVGSISSTSLRATNFNPRFSSLAANLKAGPHALLEEICKEGTLKRGGRYKRIDATPEYGYLMVGQKQVFWLQAEGQWIARTCVDGDVLVSPGTMLIAGAGTLGESEAYCRTEFIWKDTSKNAFSELFVRVVSNPEIMPPGCLYAFMRSETAFRMLRSISFGSKLQYPLSALLKKFPIPLPEPQVRSEIHELVISAYEAREKAVRIRTDAIAQIEGQIEGGD